MDINELTAKLNDLSSWRIAEIDAASKLVAPNDSDDNSESKDSPASSYLRRSLVIILYAHCDGFLKEATKCYLEYIRYNKPKWHQTNIAWFAIEHKSMDFADDKNTKLGKSVGLFIKNESGELLTSILFKDKGDLKDADKIFNKNNFSFGFLHWMFAFVLQIRDVPDFPLIKTLKALRDDIAHGKQVYKDKAGCEDLVRDTLEFLNLLSDKIIDHCRDNMTA